MLILTSRKSFIIWGAVLVIFIILLLLPIKIKYNIFVRGKILPAKEWIIYKGTDGRLTSLLTDYKSGINQSYDVTLFDRGDAMQFALDNELSSGKRINKYDTIATIFSSEIEREIESLNGDILSAKASLTSNLTGEKSAIVEQEQKNLAYAIKQAEEQKKILDRFSALYEKGLVSQEEYELAKGTYDLNMINISIAEARLSTVKTGAKQEEIGLIRSQIASLEKELSVMQKRHNSFTITSPVDGIINRKTNSDTLIIVSDNSEYVVMCPVKVNDRKYLKTSTPIEIHSLGNKQNVTAKIYEIDKSVKVVNGLQVFIITASILGETDQLYPSLIVDCYIDTGDLSLLEYIERIWQRMVN